MVKKLSKKERLNRKLLINGDLIMQKKIHAIILNKFLIRIKINRNLKAKSSNMMIKLTFFLTSLIGITKSKDKHHLNQLFNK